MTCNDPASPLIPDPYCLMTDGYRTLRERMQRIPLPPWHERLPLAFWRGSTTGSKDIDLNTLELNRRYQLSRLSRKLARSPRCPLQPSCSMPRCSGP